MGYDRCRAGAGFVVSRLNGLQTFLKCGHRIGVGLELQEGTLVVALDAPGEVGVGECAKDLAGFTLK